jgi:uncharacterized protein (DUF1778 family)
MAPASTTKTRRLEARIDDETDGLITSAAARLGQSKSFFVTSAARAAAEKVLARGDATLMPAAQFDALLGAPDAPDAAPALAAQAAKPRVFDQR